MSVSRLGRFEIVKEIGRGAMGQVFLANDPKIDRKVAIKTIVLPPGTSAEEAHETSQRFLREAQAAGKLLHPNIVTIFDVGEDQGVTFIAMEFIEGETLEKHIKQGHLLPPRQVQELMAQAASALDYAHQNGIVHRDVKPANLMVVKGGGLKVTDFGLAKNPSANLTQAGVLLGTPSYMSPEQIQGQDLDGRSDLFSLAVVLYELLTGVRPFEGESISTIIYRVLYEDPRPPAAHNPALPPEINAILERGLAKEKEDRYRTCADMVADLNKAFAGLPPETLSKPFPVVAGPPGRRAATTTMRRTPSGRAPRTERGRPAPARARLDEGPQPTFIARHPIKIAALLATGVAAITLFPRNVNRREMPGQAAIASVAGGGAPPVAQPGAGGEARQPAPAGPGAGDAPASIAGIGGTGGAAAAGTVTGVQGDQVIVDVETIPHGGAVTLDSTPLASPRVVLSRSDPKPHDIVAAAGCRPATAEMTASDLASFKGSMVMELQPREAEVLVDSEPGGAHIVLNGKDTGKTTPARLPINACDKRAVRLERDGYRPWSQEYDADTDFDAMSTALGKVRLEAIPKGTVRIKKPAEYDVDVYLGSKKIGRAGEALELPEGKHTLTFRNEKMFVNQSLQVAVTGGKESQPLVALPILGSLTVQAQPSNCKVYVDGVYVDVTPIIEMPISSGGHRVKVVFVPSGAEQEVPVSVDGRKAALVTVKF